MRVMQTCDILKTNPVHMPVMQCYFVVWTPRFTQLTVIPYDSGYAKHMLVMVNRFYRRYYLPNLILKLCDKLPHGQVVRPGHYPLPDELPAGCRWRAFYAELTEGWQRASPPPAAYSRKK